MSDNRWLKTNVWLKRLAYEWVNVTGNDIKSLTIRECGKKLYEELVQEHEAAILRHKEALYDYRKD